MHQYKILFNFLQKHLFIYFIILTGMVISTITISLIAILMGPLFTLLFNGEQKTLFSLTDLIDIKYLSVLPSNIVDHNLIFDRLTLFQYLPLTVIIISLIKAVATFLYSFLLQRNGEMLAASLRNRLIRELLTRSLGYFSGAKVGELMTQLSHNINMVKILYTRLIGGAVQESGNLIIAISFMLFINYRLFIFFLIIAPITALSIKVVGKRIISFASRSLYNLSQLNNHIHQILSGIETIKSFQTENLETKRFNYLNNLLFRSSKSGLRIKSFSAPVLEFLGMCAGALVVYYASNLIYSGAISKSNFISFFAFAVVTAQSGQKFGWIINSMQDGRAALKQLNIFFNARHVDFEEEQKGRKGDEGNTGDLGNKMDNDLVDEVPKVPEVSEVLFDNLSFSYNSGSNNETPVFTDLSFKVKKGELLAIVGESGAGKSTIINLILGFIKQQAGSIKINNINLQHLTLKEIRNLISIVTQDVFLFSDTIAANICYPQKYIPDLLPDIISSAKQGAVHEFVETLYDGYLQLVGECGHGLSQGQKQRISLARALYRNSPILLLDEPFSNVDGLLEEELFNRIQEIKSQKVVIYIAHRLQNAMRADKVIVLNNNHDGIVEQGVPDDLIQSKGVFFQMTQRAGIVL